MRDWDSELVTKARDMGRRLGTTLRDASLGEFVEHEVRKLFWSTDDVPLTSLMAEALGFSRNRERHGGLGRILADVELAVRAIGSARLGGTSPPEDVVRDVVSPSGPVIGTFAHTVSRSSAPSRIGLASSGFHVGQVEDVEAPVEAVFGTPGGGELGMRRLGTLWLRPVLAPDGWRPCGVDEFMRSASVGAAWRDNPFSEGLTHTKCAFAMTDYASSEFMDAFLTKKARREGDEIVARIGPLRCVEGIVHVETEEPVLDLVTAVPDEGAQYRWTWRSGGMSGLARQGTLHTSEIRGPMRADRMLAHRREVDLSLPYWDVVTAERVSAAWNDLVHPRDRRTSDICAVDASVKGCNERHDEESDRAVRCITKAMEMSRSLDWPYHPPHVGDLKGSTIEMGCHWALKALEAEVDPLVVAAQLRGMLPDQPASSVTLPQLLCAAFVMVAAASIEASIEAEPDEPEVEGLRF